MDKTQGKNATTTGLPIQRHDTLSAEKQNDSVSDSVEIADEKIDAYIQPLDENEKPEYRNGEPVITTGRDVSRFAVDIRDDGDESLTFRSIFLGTLFAGMSAALCQVSIPCGPSYNCLRPNDFAIIIVFCGTLTLFAQIYHFKPVQMTVSTVFLLLIIYTTGNAWAKFLPRRSWVADTRFERLAPVFHFINPGPFSLKEVRIFHLPLMKTTEAIWQHVVASLVASTAASGSTAVQNFAVQRVGVFIELMNRD